MVKVINPAILLMLLVALFQSIFSAIVKFLGNDISTGIAVLSYYVIPLAFLLPIFIYSKGSWLKTDKLTFLLVRGILASSAVFCFFYATKHIPLGVAAVLFNTMPVFVPLLAKVFLNEQSSKQLWLGIVISLMGIMFVIHPGINGFFKIGSFAGLAAGILMAISQVMLKSLVKEKVSINQIVFYLYLMSSIIASTVVVAQYAITDQPSIIFNHNNSMFIFGMLILLGCASLASQRLMTYAFHFMPATKLVPILYASVPISSLIGWALWQQQLTSDFYIGASMVFSGVLLITFDKN